MRKLLLILLIAVFALTAFKCGKDKPPKDSTIFPPPPIAASKFPGVLKDFKQSPQGVKIMGGFAPIRAEYVQTAEDACIARIETFKANFPAWTAAQNPSACEAMLLQADGVLDTIPNYPREYLMTTNGIRTAGTVMFSAFRVISLLPDYTRAQNRHFEFWSFYNEWEHGSSFLNRGNAPLNHWQKFIGAGDTHPQETPLEKWIPDYAKTFPSVMERNPFDDELTEVIVIAAEEKEFEQMKESIQSDSLKSGKKVEIYRIEKKKADEFFDYIDELKSDFEKAKQ